MVTGNARAWTSRRRFPIQQTEEPVLSTSESRKRKGNPSSSSSEVSPPKRKRCDEKELPVHGGARFLRSPKVDKEMRLKHDEYQKEMTKVQLEIQRVNKETKKRLTQQRK